MLSADIPVLFVQLLEETLFPYQTDSLRFAVQNAIIEKNTEGVFLYENRSYL